MYDLISVLILVAIILALVVMMVGMVGLLRRPCPPVLSVPTPPSQLPMPPNGFAFPVIESAHVPKGQAFVMNREVLDDLIAKFSEQPTIRFEPRKRP